MRYFLDDEEVTIEELEDERDDWEFHGDYGEGHQVIALEAIRNNCIYFYRLMFEC